uniref:Uncharacterized protein n=1 Tax=Knipowitschia caucasica TaxID=637954 RepID=A0AAV2KMC9_KNICA
MRASEHSGCAKRGQSRRRFCQWSNTETDPKVSDLGTVVHREERTRGQMSGVMSVRRDKLRLGYHLLLGACSRLQLNCLSLGSCVTHMQAPDTAESGASWVVASLSHDDA